MNDKTRARVITILMAALLIMTIGYAALKANLSISGTSNITSTWDVRIIDITSTPSGDATNRVEPSYTATTANFSTLLVNPGDSMVYNVTVKNNGTLDAILGSFTDTKVNNTAISFVYENLENNTILKAGQTMKFSVIVFYNDVTTQPENLSADLTLTLNYRQNNVNIADTYVSYGAAGEYVLKTAEASETSGLYDDEYISGRKLFRGADVENYMTFNGEDAYWRIMSIEPNGTIKLIRSYRYDTGDFTKWDTTNNRSGSTYCTGTSCNFWASTSNIKDKNGNSVTEITQYYPNNNSSTDTEFITGTVNNDAFINTYMNTTYFDTIIGKENLVPGDFYIGSPGSPTDEDDMATNLSQTMEYVWTGKVGLISILDFMRGSLNENCTTLKNLVDETNLYCQQDNWLYFGRGEWTLSPSMTGTNKSTQIWYTTRDGAGATYISTSSAGNRPVVYLDSNTVITGKGTQDNPYRILDSLNNDDAENPMVALKLLETKKPQGLTTASDGTLYYAGEAADNYIDFNCDDNGKNCETWRIMKTDKSGNIKIIRGTYTSELAAVYWDIEGNQDLNVSTYCANNKNYGCNAWAATNNLVGAPSIYSQYYPNGNKNSDTTIYSGIVANDSTLNVLLNTTYYNGLSNSAKRLIILHDWYVSSPGNSSDTESIETNEAQEKLYVWRGKVGLMTASEYMRGSTNSDCLNLRAASNNPYPCGKSNWLDNGLNEWTLSPSVNYKANYVWLIHLSSGINDIGTSFDSYGARPAVWISSSTMLSGNGSSSKPFKIVLSNN